MEEEKNINPSIETKASTSANNKSNNLLAIALGLIGLSVIILYILCFTGKAGKTTPPPAAVVADSIKGLTVAYVNTDTLMAKYQYAIDLQTKLESLQAQKSNEYKAKVKKFQDDALAFQTDYQNYLKTGDQLTLSQQQSKEKTLTNLQANLQERELKLQELEVQMAQQLQLQTLQESEKMTNAVYAFIRDYNEKYLHYDIILSKSFTASPVLYGNPTLDITNVIVDALNEEYAGLEKEEAKLADDEKK